MKFQTLKIAQCESSEHLMDLYNKWTDKTMFLSTGNCNVEEWAEFVEYGKKNPDESARFIIEYLDEAGGDWIIETFASEVFYDPIVHEDSSEYINPALLTTVYKILALSVLGEIDLDIKDKN